MCARDKNESLLILKVYRNLFMFLVISKVDVLFMITIYPSTEIYDHHIYKTISFDNGR